MVWTFEVKYRCALRRSNVAADVEEVGEGVTTFVKGDRVCVVSRLLQQLHIKNPECSFAQGQYKPDWATFQQYAKTDAATTSKVCSPTNLNFMVH